MQVGLEVICVALFHLPLLLSLNRSLIPALVCRPSTSSVDYRMSTWLDRSELPGPLDSTSSLKLHIHLPVRLPPRPASLTVLPRIRIVSPARTYAPDPWPETNPCIELTFSSALKLHPDLLVLILLQVQDGLLLLPLSSSS